MTRTVNGTGQTVLPSSRKVYARALYEDPTATLDDLRKAVTALEEIERTMRRVFGVTHPLTTAIGVHLENSRAVLRARESS